MSIVKLSKSLEIVRLNRKEAGKSMPPDVKEALRLAEESEVFILESRITTPGSVPELLKGETIA